MRILNETGETIEAIRVPAAGLAELIRVVNDGDLPSSRAVEVFSQMLTGAQTVAEAMKALGIEEVDDREMIALCERLLAANPRVVADVRTGKQQAIGALIGQARQSNPNVDPAQVRRICLELIKGEG